MLNVNLVQVFLCCFFHLQVAAQKASTLDVGIVMPTQVNSGETISASLVTNPGDYATIQGLRVVPS
jgi:hypothetical protein